MIHKLIYHLFLYPLSRMPYGFLYLFSDFVCFVLYYVVGFRKSIVRANLKKSFPEKSSQERLIIEKKFYTHMCDLIIESIKAFSISEKEVIKRMDFPNVDLLENLVKENKDVVFVGGHVGSWELFAMAVARKIPFAPRAFYKPLSNSFWDTKMNDSRSKYGLEMINMSKAKDLFKQKVDVPTATIFGSDQSPSNGRKAFWVNFLNQETGFQYGAEKYAIEHNAAVVFGYVTRVKRGFYETRFELINDGKSIEYGQVMIPFASSLEDKIRKFPEQYLWTHRRWKHKRPEGVEIY